jgi:hypothetical protein
MLTASNPKAAVDFRQSQNLVQKGLLCRSSRRFLAAGRQTTHMRL